MAFSMEDYHRDREGLRRGAGFVYDAEADVYPTAEQMWDYIGYLEATVLAQRKVSMEIAQTMYRPRG